MSQDLQDISNLIRNETDEGGNTKERVASAFDIVNTDKLDSGGTTKTGAQLELDLIGSENSELLFSVGETINGLGINGASFSVDTLTIPQGSTGYNSYLAFIYSNMSDIIPTAVEAIAKGCSVRFILKFKKTGTLPAGFYSAIQKQGGVSVTKSTKQIDTGDYLYYILNTTSITSDITSLQLFIQQSYNSVQVQAFSIQAVACYMYFEGTVSERYNRKLQGLLLDRIINISSIDNRIVNFPYAISASATSGDNERLFMFSGNLYSKIFGINVFSKDGGGTLEVGKTLYLKYNIKEEKNSGVTLINFNTYPYIRYNGTTTFKNPLIILLGSDSSFNYYTVEFNIPVISAMQQINGAFEIALMCSDQRTISKPWNIEIYNIKLGYSETNTQSNDSLRNKLNTLDDEILSIKDSIGSPYTTSVYDALVQVTPLPLSGVTVRSNGKGITIPSGISELNNELRIRLRYSDFASIPNGAMDIRLGFNGTSSNTFETKMYSLDGALLGVASNYYDSNNGLLRINYPITKNRSMPYIECRVKCTSSVSNGFDLFYNNTLIEGQNKLSPINERLISLESSNRPLAVMASNGDIFKITVDNNGILSTSPYYFRRVLVLSHSFGKHEPSLSIGWNGNWGMAASSESKDFAHVLISKMQTVNPDTELAGIYSLQPFEAGHQNSGFNYSQFDYLNDLDFDCVVIKIGENVQNSSNLGADMITLLSQHIIKDKPCKVFIASMWYTSSDTEDNLTGINAQFKQVADYYNTKVVMINDSSYENTAWSTPLPALPNGQQPDKGSYASGGWQIGDVTADNGRVYVGVVGGHPGDNGHEVIANAFWDIIQDTQSSVSLMPKHIPISQTDYNSLSVKDPNTIYYVY